MLLLGKGVFFIGGICVGKGQALTLTNNREVIFYLFQLIYFSQMFFFFDKLVSSFLPSLPISGFEPVTMPDELILERADVYKTNGTRLHFAKSVPRISLSSLTIILSIHVENGVIYMLSYSELLTLNQLYCHCNAISCHGYGFFFSF